MAESSSTAAMADPAAAWLDDEAERVVAQAEQAIEQHGVSARQRLLHRSLLRHALRPDDTGASRCGLALRLPLLAAEAVRGEIGADDRRLASALVVLEAGIYALDHLMDDEVAGELGHWGTAALVLGGCSLVSHLPQQILAQDGAAGPALAGPLAEGLARMAAGQLDDVEARLPQPVASTAVMQAVIMKTGERRALYAGLAALRAGGSAAEVEGYGELGRQLGVARQLKSDLLDLFGAAASRDLAAGAVTLPLALFFERAEPARQDAMRRFLTACVDPAERQRGVRGLLRDTGCMRAVVAIVQDACSQAMRQLDRLQPRGRAAGPLRGFIEAAAVFSPARRAA